MKLPKYSELKEKFERHLIPAAALTAAVLLLGSWSFFTKPALELADEQKAHSLILEERLKVLQEFAQREDYADYENNLRQQLKQAESLFVRKDQLNEVVGRLQRLAERQQLRVVAVRMPENGGKKPECWLPVETFDVQLSLHGDYHALAGFVRQTENKYRVTSMTLEGRRDGTIVADMELELPRPV